MRRSVALLMVLASTVAACGDTTPVRVGPLPLCVSTDQAMLILMAQAVPTAEQIPCVEEIPVGWGLRQADIESGEVELTFGHQGFGEVTVTLTSTCDWRRDESQDEADGLEVSTVESRGGCVTVEAPRRVAATEMTAALSFVTRESLREQSGLELRDRR